MRSITTCFIVFFVVAWHQSTAFGLVLNTVGINMQARAFSYELGTNVYEEHFLNYSDSQTSLNHEIAKLEHVGNINNANALVTINAEAFVVPGALSASMSGFAIADAGGLRNSLWAGRAEMQNARVNINYTDTLTIRDLDKPGQRIVVQAFWKMTGDLNAGIAFVGAEFGARASVSTSTLVSVLGGPTQQGFASASDIQPAPVKVPLPVMIPTTMVTIGGVPTTLTTSMELRGGALSTTTPGSLVSQATSHFTNEFLHTLSWGGIISVTNADTGEPIRNWSITSETGFDYSQPYPIPEPSLIALVMVCVGISGFRRHSVELSGR